MTVNINYSTSVQVNGELALSSSKAVPAQAYDEVSVTVPAGSTVDVDVQPGSTDQVRFLLIHSSVLDPDLTYDVDGGETGLKLDSVHTFTGAGMIGLLGGDPKKLTFKNETDMAADIRILVGREASTPGGGGP